MTTVSTFRIGVVKESRALWAIWATCAAAMLAASMMGNAGFARAGLLAYVVGSIAIAAMSIGHEYTHATLPLLLSLPTDRRRLLLTKLAVMVPMLATLGGLALAALPPPTGSSRGDLMPALMLACALLLTPWLTMVCRSPLGGGVFAVCIVGTLLLAADAARLAGLTPDLLWWELPVAGAIGAAAAWRSFMRLEARDGGEVQLHLPRLLQVRAARDRHPIWLLVLKELRLQQISFVVAATYALLWAGIGITWSGREEVQSTLVAVGFVYGGLLSVLMGSLASAEERRLGTLEWQLLMPIAVWKQWVVKSVVVIGLALALCVVLPVVLATGQINFNLLPFSIVLVLTVGSLYASSLCGSGIKALATSAPVMVGVLLLIVSWSRILQGVLVWPLQIVTVAFVVLALRFAYENHTTVGLDVRRVRWHLLWLVLLLAALKVAY